MKNNFEVQPLVLQYFWPRPMARAIFPLDAWEMRAGHVPLAMVFRIAELALNTVRRVNMRESFLAARWNTILSSGLGLVIAVFVIAVMTSIKIPLVSGDKTNFLILAVLGMLLCFLGYSHSAMTFGWTNSQYWAHPISKIGMGLGALALLLIIFTLGNIRIPLISGYKTAFLALAIIVFVKLGLKVLQNIILEIKG